MSKRIFLRLIDGKGRVIIPAEFRRQLKDSIIITPDLDSKKCLLVFPVGHFRENNFEVVQKLKMSKEGRILIPISLRKLVNLEGKEVVILGSGDHIQIWSRESWEEKITTTSSKEMTIMVIIQKLKRVAKELNSYMRKYQEISVVLKEILSQIEQHGISINALILTLARRQFITFDEFQKAREEITEKINLNH